MELRGTESRPLLARGPSLGVRALLLVMLSVTLMVLDHQQGTLATLRNSLSVLLHPVRLIVNFPFGVARWLDEALASREQLSASNEQLWRQLLEQNARLQRMAALEAENTALRAMMRSSARVSDRIKVTEILSVALDPFQHRLVIDKGTMDGAYQGQALIDADGIMGQITRAEPLASEAILISDPSHAVPVEVARNGLRTIAVGTGDLELLNVPFLPNNADIVEGDLLLSSGLGGTFPAGYPVATVTRVERIPGESFATVYAAPAAALNRSRRLLLVWPAQQSPAAAESAPEVAEEDAATGLSEEDAATGLAEEDAATGLAEEDAATGLAEEDAAAEVAEGDAAAELTDEGAAPEERP